MAQETPEALLIPAVNPLARLRPLTPVTAIANAATSLKVYDESIDAACEDIVLQNLGTVAVKVTWNQPASEESFHEVLAGGSAQDDGFGGNTTLNVKKYGMRNVSLWCGSAAIRCLVTRFQRNSQQQWI